MSSPRFKIAYVFVGCLLVTAAVGGMLAKFVKDAYFPFVEIEQVPPFVFNSAPEDFPVSLDAPALEGVIPDGSEPFPVRLARFVRTHMKHGEGHVLTSPEEALEGREIEGVCSEYSKLAVSAAEGAGVPARVVWMEEHTVSEIWDEELGKWILVDTNGNQMWYALPEGEAENLTEFPPAEIDHSTPLNSFELAQKNHPLGLRSTMPPPPLALPLIEGDTTGPLSNDPFFGGEHAGIYDQGLMVIIEGPHLYDFHERNRDPSVLLGYLLGGEPVARGIQVQLLTHSRITPAGSVIWAVRAVAAALLALWIWFAAFCLWVIRKHRKA